MKSLIIIFLFLLTSCIEKEKEEEIKPRICFKCTQVTATFSYGYNSANYNHPILESDSTTIVWNECELTKKEIDLIQTYGSLAFYSIMHDINLVTKRKIKCVEQE